MGVYIVTISFLLLVALLNFTFLHVSKRTGERDSLSYTLEEFLHHCLRENCLGLISTDLYKKSLYSVLTLRIGLGIVYSINAANELCFSSEQKSK